MIMRRVHRVAVFVAWMSASMVATIGVMMLLLTSDWFLSLVNRPHWNITGAQKYPQYVPSVLIDIGPELMLALGFIIIVSAMLGGFRKEL
jgi:hypothetical protein